MTDFTYETPPGFWRLFWARGSLLPLGLALFLVIVSLVISPDVRMAIAMKTIGEQVRGDVIDREMRLQVVGDRTQRVYYVTVQYKVFGTKTITEQQVPLEIYEASPPGIKRDVRFLPERPEVVEISVGQHWRDGRNAQWISMLVGLVATVMLVYRGRSIMPSYTSRLYGQAERAHVLGIARSGNQYALVWRDARGLVGESLPSGPERYTLYRPGSLITLYRYRNAKPWWTGDVGNRTLQNKR